MNGDKIYRVDKSVVLMTTKIRVTAWEGITTIKWKDGETKGRTYEKEPSKNCEEKNYIQKTEILNNRQGGAKSIMPLQARKLEKDTFESN